MELITLDHHVQQIDMQNDMLYALGNSFDTETATLYQYNLHGNQLELKNEAGVYTTANESQHFYVTGFFLNR